MGINILLINSKISLIDDLLNYLQKKGFHLNQDSLYIFIEAEYCTVLL
jgi:hypothetical protein